MRRVSKDSASSRRYVLVCRIVGVVAQVFCTFVQVQDFWRIYNHLMRPNDLPNTMDYHLFKTGIKPMWEDPANRRGGKWMVRLRKGIASRYWEDLVRFMDW